jgi:hypothetical protein
MVPERCSISIKGRACTLPPSQIVSIISEDEEYMIGLVCSEHVMLMKTKALSMQNSGELSMGKLKFQKIKTVMTDCVLNQKNINHNGNCL